MLQTSRDVAKKIRAALRHVFMHKHIALYIMVASVSMVAKPATAQMMLYDDQFPDGYAFVRFANLTSSSMAITPVGFADAIVLGTSDVDRVSAYHVVERVVKRTLIARIDAAQQISFELQQGAFETILIHKDGDTIVAKTLNDDMELTQTKARLSFYNAEAACHDGGLFLQSTGQAIFENVAPNSVRSRSVNPSASPRVRISCGPSRTNLLDLGSLEAGGQYSVWLLAPGNHPTAFLIKNKIAPFVR